MIRFIAIVMSTFLAVVSLGNRTVQGTEIRIDFGDAYVEKTLTYNDEIASAFSGDFDIRASNDARANIRINRDRSIVDLSLNYNGERISAVLYGYDESVVTDKNIEGHFGVYEGFADFVSSKNFAFNSLGQLPIIANVIFNDSEIFATITVGCILPDFAPIILIFGELTDSFIDISNERAKRTTMMHTGRDIFYRDEDIFDSKAHVIDDDGGGGDGEYSDFTCRLQATRNAFLENKSIARFAFYHSNAIRNGGVMNVYAAMSPNSAAVEEYVKNTLGYEGSISSYPDNFNISICGNHNNLYHIVNGYIPQHNETTADLPIPLYLGDIIGFQTINIPITTSYTHVTRSNYSQFQNNKNRIEWDIYKRHGWNNSDFALPKAMAPSATYTFQGAVSNKFNTSMTATANVRFETIVVQNVLGTTVSHFISTTSDVLSITTDLTVYP